MAREKHRPLRFIMEKLIFLPISGPELAGQKVGAHICDFQKNIIKSIFSEDGKSIKKSPVICFARKLGKSLLYSWISLYLLSQKVGWQGIVAASTFSQSDFVFSQARRQLELNPYFKNKGYRITREVISNEKKDNSLFRIFSRSSSNLGRVNISSAIFDQLESWDSRDLYDAIVSGMMLSQSKPLTMLASNCPLDVSHWSLDFLKEKKKDPRFKFFQYSAPLAEPWDTFKAKASAQPFYKLYHQDKRKYRHFKTLVQNIDAEERVARRSVAESLAYRRYTLGQNISAECYKWIDPNSIKLATMSDANRLEGRWVLGFDLAYSKHFCAAGAFKFCGEKVFMQPFLHIANTEGRTKKQATIFKQWDKLGFIKIHGQENINKKFFLSDIKNWLEQNKISISAHAWDKGLFASELGEQFPKDPYLVRGYPANVTAPIRVLEAKALAGDLFLLGENPAVRWMLDCSIVSSKSKGFCGIDKASDRESIDFSIAMIVAQKWVLDHPQRRWLIMSG